MARRIAVLFPLLLACSAARIDGEQQHPTATFPAKLERDPAAPAPSASAKSTPPEPDPPAVSSKDQWQLDLEYSRGAIRVSAAQRFLCHRSRR